jgi:hypothetical protein
MRQSEAKDERFKCSFIAGVAASIFDNENESNPTTLVAKP